MRGRPKNGSARLPSKGKKAVSKSSKTAQAVELEQMESDFAALDEFCKQHSDINDLSLDDWESVHNSLDVHVPIWLEGEMLPQSPTITVKFMRRILSAPENGILKEAAEVCLKIPFHARNGDKIVIAGLGDRQNLSRGDLIVTLHLRKPTPSR